MKWYNVAGRAEKLRPVSIIIGGRGIGKTYSAIDFAVNSGRPFVYMRNTDTQMQESSSAFGNPFKRWARDHGRDVRLVAEKKHYMIYEYHGDADRELIGYGVALSTFESLRGVDLSDVELVVFDEFIENRTLAFDQFSAFANFYETVNRNRELTGEKPLMCILLSNAQRLTNAILAGYGCIDIIERMIKSGQHLFTNEYLMIELPESEVSEAKKKTANYRLTEGSRFYDEALKNSFANDSFAGIKKRPLSEYIPIVGIDDIYIYRHKSSGRLYASRVYSNTVALFSSRDSLPAFLRQFGALLRESAIAQLIDYQDFATKVKLTEILRI